MVWYGADPGGKGRFGLAQLNDDGTFNTKCVSSVDEALQFIDAPTALGIDCPMWWSTASGGGRKADRWLRSTYNISSGTVQSVNSLSGAAVVQGILLAMRVRDRNPTVAISEAHPKALKKAFQVTSWSQITDLFCLLGEEPLTEHECDALLSAVAAREGALMRWTRDLSTDRCANELDPEKLWFGSVNYWWPNVGELKSPVGA